MQIKSENNGWRISGIKNIKLIPHHNPSIVTLEDVDKLSLRSAQWILNRYDLIRLNPKTMGCNFGVIMCYDNMAKVSIMENHPDIENELVNFFNPIVDDWTKCHLRFS